MPRIKPSYLITTLALTAAGSGHAQSLSGEVLIDRQVQPVERNFSRPTSVTPRVYTPDVQFKPLKPAAYNGTGQLSRSLSRLEPASDGDTLVVDDSRGYASIGYFPTYNLAASAGFRLINSRTTRLATFLQYDGMSYKVDSRTAPDERLTVANHAFTVGADLSTFLSRTYRLNGNFAYTFGDVSMPWGGRDIDGGTNHARLALGLHAGTRLPFNIALRYSHFGFRGNTPYVVAMVPRMSEHSFVSPISEDRFTISGDVEYRTGSHAWSLDVSADIQHLSDLARIWPVAMLQNGADAADAYNPVATYYSDGAHTPGVMALTPAYSFNSGNWGLRLGARLDLATGCGSTSFRVAPDVHISWIPNGVFSAEATFAGGNTLNALEDLYAEKPWMIPAFSYAHSKVPVTAEVALNFGPFDGFSARAFASYAAADSWLMPGVAAGETNEYQYQNVRGWLYGLKLGYKYRSLLDVHACVEGASHGGPRSAYYLWRDRAAWRSNIGVTVTPVARLSLSLDYDMAGGRKVFNLVPDNYLNLAWFNSDETFSLGAIRDLSFSGSYGINDAFTVFANVSNILCRRHQMVYGIDSPRLSGMAGVSFKF